MTTLTICIYREEDMEDTDKEENKDLEQENEELKVTLPFGY